MTIPEAQNFLSPNTDDEDGDWEDLTLEGCSCVLMLEASEKPSIDKDTVSLVTDEKGGMLAYWYKNNQLEPHPVALKDISTLKNIFGSLKEIDSEHDQFEEVISLCNTPQVKQFYQPTLGLYQNYFPLFQKLRQKPRGDEHESTTRRSPSPTDRL